MKTIKVSSATDSVAEIFATEANNCHFSIISSEIQSEIRVYETMTEYTASMMFKQKTTHCFTL